MRAVLLTGFGGPEKLSYVKDAPDPRPAAGEVLVKVAATALNNTDIWTREGAYGGADDPSASSGWRREAFTFPRIQGADVAGHIDAVGQGVSAARVGEHVLLDPMLYDGDERALVRTRYLGSERDGGFAEFTTIPAANAHRIDGTLTDAEWASFPTAYTTAMRMLNRAAVTRGDRIVVTGASGGVGSALIQLATLRGAEVTALVGAGKADRARALGASTTADRDQAASLPTGTFDVIADVVGGSQFASLLAALGPLGRYVTAGAIAGPIVAADLRTIYLNQISLIGSSFGTHDDFRAVVAHALAGELTPLLADSYPLAELARAQEEFVAKKFFGKLVVTP